MRIELNADYVSVINTRTGEELASLCRVARSNPDRIRGLLGEPLFVRGQGLWIVPCDRIHTLGMRFPIEVLYLDAAHRVMVVSPVPMDVELDHVPGAHSVVELPEYSTLAVRPGDLLRFGAIR